MKVTRYCLLISEVTIAVNTGLILPEIQVFEQYNGSNQELVYVHVSCGVAVTRKAK